MAFTPSGLEYIENTEDLQAVTRLLNNIAVGTSDYVANHAVQLFPDMVDLLRAEGVDGQAGFLGRGSIAEQNAKRVYLAMRKTSDAFFTAGKLALIVEPTWQKYIVEPVKAAQAQRNRSGRTLKV